jgi:two-component system, NarL family, sensor histidine kinase EvgS
MLNFLKGHLKSIAVVGALLIFAGITWSEWRHAGFQRDSADWVARTHQVQAALNKLALLHSELENDEYQYLLTGDSGIGAHFETEASKLPELLTLLDQLVSDEAQKKNVATLESLIEARVAAFRANIAARRTQGPAPSARAAAIGAGNREAQRIERHFDKMEARQLALLESRVAAAQLQSANEQWLKALGTVVGVALFIISFWISFSEIGLRRDAVEALKKNAVELNRFKNTLDKTLDCIFHFPYDSLRFSYANVGAAEFSGYARDELLQAGPTTLLPEYDAAALRQRLLPLVNDLVPSVVFETVLHHKSGRDIPVEAFMQLVREPGQPDLIVNVLRDISAHRNAERALLDAKAEAEGANAAKGVLVATVSHEIRTPLAGLMGMLELLSLTKLDREQRETLDTARDSGRGLGRIIDDVLDHAKIGAGKLDIVAEPMSVRSLFMRLANNHRAVASAKDLQLKSSIDPHISPWLLADPVRLQQILGNLVSNAIKFTPAGHVELRAELVGSREGKDTIRLVVADTGLGMDEATQSRLFLPFEQASAKTSRQFGGTGLGLSISRRLVDLMGGDIRLESKIGSGTLVSVELTLPAAEAPQADAAHAEATERSGGAGPGAAENVAPLDFGPGAPRPRILAVDDHPINRHLLERQISLLGLDVEVASDGSEALQKWREGRQTMVITDCNMPGMDGYALCRAIREEESRLGMARTPVVAWTANAMREAADQCKAAGMDDLMTKPTELSRLRAILAKYLVGVESANLAAEAGRDALATPGTEADAAPIDLSVLAAVTDGDQDFADTIVEMFHKGLPGQIEALQASCAASDFEAIKRVAHKLAGSASTIGAVPLANVCREMERNAMAHNALPIQHLRKELSAAVAALNRYLAATVSLKVA